MTNIRSRSSAMPALSLRRKAPRSRFSFTVRFKKMPRPSGAWASPRATMSCGMRRVSSSPLKRTEPALGRSMREMARRVVVLPAPFAPMSATTLPSGTSSETPRSASMTP